MKYSSLLTVLVLFTGLNTVLSQVPYIDLTFTGSFSGMHVPLDSIRIINETQQADTMLYGNDTVLHLEYETGIDEQLLIRGDRFASGDVYPNPTVGFSELDAFVPDKGQLTAQISDISGRMMLREEMELMRGLHKFRFSAGREGIYFLTLTFDDESITRRVVMTGSSLNEPSIEHEGMIGMQGQQKNYSANGFPFSPGDILRFFGYAATDGDTLQDTPTENSDYIFIFTRGGFPCPDMPSIEFGGQTYNTVQVGNQCWLRENLNIGQFTNSGTMQTNNEVVEKFCYLDLEDYCDTYGGLYQWNEMMQYASASGNQGICPNGWHVPEEEEWNTMMAFLGGDKDAGGFLKEEGTLHWDSPNTEATNRSGFTALPGGQCEGNAIFTGEGNKAYFWCSTTDGLLNSIFWELRHNSGSLVEGSQVRSFAKSVRCLRDD